MGLDAGNQHYLEKRQGGAVRNYLEREYSGAVNYVGNVNPRFPLARGAGGWHYISLPRGPERPQAAYLGNRIPRGAGETPTLRRRKTDGIFENHLLN